MIVGTISAPLDAGHDRLLGDIREVQERAEHEDEVKLVESMITSAMKGDRAVLGISDTLAAIEQGRVHFMVVARDFHAEGKQCTSCQILVVDEWRGVLILRRQARTCTGPYQSGVAQGAGPGRKGTDGLRRRGR